MKKIFFAILAMLLTVSAQAQIVTSHSKTKYKVKKNWNIEWIVRAGVNINSITASSNATFNPASKIGYNASFAMNLPLMKSGLYFGAEIGAVSAGFDDECPELSHGVEFTPSIGWKIKLSNSLKLDVHLGAFYDYYYECGYADYHRNYHTWVYDPWSNDMVHELQTEENHYKVNDQDYGIKAGIGLWYKKFNLDFTFHRGFKTVCEVWGHEDDNTRYDYSNQNFMIRLGYSF